MNGNISALRSTLRLETVRLLTIPALCFSMFLVYSTVRVAAFPAFELVRTFPDTPVYTKLASKPIWSPSFWTGPRPWTTPLLFKLAGNEPRTIAVFQLAISVICWGLLALAVAQSLRVSWLKPLAFGTILLFSLSAEIIMWDGVILSDSISLSLMALLIASWLWLLKSFNWITLILVALIALLWSFARDTNAWILLFIAIAIVIGFATRLVQGRYILLAAAFLAIFALDNLSANLGRRWVNAFMNSVGTRILTSPEHTRYFEQLGMPVTPALIRRVGSKAWSDNWAFYNDPELEEFRRWLYAHGKVSFMWFLLSHPAITLQEPLRHLEKLVAPRLQNYAPINFSPILPKPLAEIVYVKEWALLSMWMAGILVGWVTGFGIWKSGNIVVIPLALIVLTYPHAVLVWHADPNEIGRHALEAGVHFRLGLWLLVLVVADSGMVRFRLRNDSVAA